jgi:two-component system, OmpR family, phosphate regulon sensor histidine kinase PhoR
MKERKLKIIVALMAAAVTGLIAIQIYWITTLIRVERERFQRTVSEAMFSATEMLEKNETAGSLMSKMSNGKKDFSIFIQSDGALNSIHENDSTKEDRFVKVESKDNTFRYQVKYTTKRDSVKNKLTPADKHKFFAKIPKGAVVFTSNGDTTFKNGKKTIQSVFKEIIEAGTRKKIEERVSKELLQKNLAEQLNNRGINLDFYFGVDKEEKDSLTLVKPGADLSELKSTKFKAALFPYEVIRGEPRFLLVYFPHQQRYLVGTIAGMLALSVGLILVIVAVFYKTVGMFLKQKKITEVKNDLINNITHEFKTPIATISLACEALNEPGMITENNSVQRFSKIINEENDRLKTMVDALLNTAAMEKDDINFKKEKTDLHELIISAVSKYNDLISQKSGKVNFEFNAAAFSVTADKFHLSNIFSNLIDNALKYNERNPEILITTYNAGTFVHVEVKDNGIGISKEHQGKIFDTFYRISKGNIQDTRGNGIGLSYAKKIVEAHNGTITVESEPGTGSVFKIILPLAGE